MLHGRSPDEAAKQFVAESKLADVSNRHEARRGRQGGDRALSDDPMIKLALAVDAEARAVRKIHEDQVEGVEAANYALIAKALFDDKGDAVYPDATFTLRLAFGVVKGYELDGKTIPPYTTIGGAFAHAKAHGNQAPLRAAQELVQSRAKRASSNLETRRSTSSRPPTSSAATRAARSSTATTRSSA